MYALIKILHIISASLLIASVGYCIQLWLKKIQTNVIIVKHTCIMLIPLSIFQLASGFYIIYLKQYSHQAFWIKASIVSFTVLILSWFGLLFFLLTENANKKNRLLQFCFISVTIAAILTMIFLMSNQIS